MKKSIGQINLAKMLGNISVTNSGSGSVGSNNPFTNISTGASGSNSIVWYENNEHIKKYEMYESTEDLLALSVCWKRLRDSYTPGQLPLGITKLIDEKLFKYVSQEDRQVAGLIRDYYSKKIMLLKLKNVPLTKFRNDLNEFVHSDGKNFKDIMLPLAYRLPEFYEYDKNFDEFTSQVNRIIKNDNKTIYSNTIRKLKLLKKIVVNRNRYRRTEYWFSDNENNLVTINFDIHNNLISLLDKCIAENEITLSGIFFKKERDGLEYYKSEKYQFI